MTNTLDIQKLLSALDNDDHKYEVLKDLYGIFAVSQCIIYCNSIKRVDDLCEAMNHDEFPVTKIHSSMEEKERKEVYQQFKLGSERVLIATDLYHALTSLRIIFFVHYHLSVFPALTAYYLNYYLTSEFH